MSPGSSPASRSSARWRPPDEPFPLYPMLEQLGCAWRCQPGSTTSFEVLIWRGDDPVAAAAAADA